MNEIGVLTEALAALPDVECAYLFGSAARGGEARDFDLALCFRPGTERPARRAIEIHAALDGVVARPVDVHAFEALPVDLQFRVLDEGRVLVDRDPGRRVAREARTMVEYYDFKPYLDRILAAAQRRLAGEGGRG